ncbi:MAG: zf-TFIIB domain-containing protein [bacterium]|nr:zf-TFIIB domain-containing protein [bacterium]
MICPVDQTPLVMTERQGIEIDYCPKCRGVWLDRGELDKIIERSAQFENAARPAAPDAPPPQAVPPQAPPVQGMPPQRPQVVVVDDDDYEDRRYTDPNSPYYNPNYKRKKSFWGDVFDIFD